MYTYYISVYMHTCVCAFIHMWKLAKCVVKLVYIRTHKIHAPVLCCCIYMCMARFCEKKLSIRKTICVCIPMYVSSSSRSS